MRALVAWRGGLFLTEGKIVVLSVSSLFLTRVGVYVCVFVYTHTHTHTALQKHQILPSITSKILVFLFFAPTGPSPLRFRNLEISTDPTPYGRFHHIYRPDPFTVPGTVKGFLKEP